jgi:signal transduction histidine kinase
MTQALPVATLPRRLVRQVGIDTAYTLSALPLAILTFTILLIGFVAGIGMVFVFGLPILAGTLYAARAFADLERLRIPSVLRRPRIRPQYAQPPADAGFWRRIFTPMTQVQPWLDLMHGIFVLIPAILAFVLVFTWWIVFYDWTLPHDPANVELPELLGWGDTAPVRVTFYTAVGLFFLLTLPLVTRGCALMLAGFGRGLLTGVTEVRGMITVLEQQRAAAVSAEATALRRLERDIHDGPQQRLVRLAMELSRAQQQLDRDPGAVRETLDEALTQTRETLDELRALSRGIAPPILADRGLPSALAALAGRCTVPVDLAVDPGLGRLDPAVENTAYFVVAESLANIAKHSHAAECWITVAAAQGKLGLVIVDDGAGGAHVSKGHGLAGLADRVRAIGGTLTVTSPPGGPTEIRTELPA